MTALAKHMINAIRHWVRPAVVTLPAGEHRIDGIKIEGRVWIKGSR